MAGVAWFAIYNAAARLEEHWVGQKVVAALTSLCPAHLPQLTTCVCKAWFITQKTPQLTWRSTG
jgi:hypothetical protein